MYLKATFLASKKPKWFFRPKKIFIDLVDSILIDDEVGDIQAGNTAVIAVNPLSPSRTAELKGLHHQHINTLHEVEKYMGLIV